MRNGEEIKSIREYVPPQYLVNVYSPNDLKGQKLIIKNAWLRAGKFGEYVELYVQTENGEEVILRTGARPILETIKQIMRDKAFPVWGVLYQLGRTWVIK